MDELSPYSFRLGFTISFVLRFVCIRKNIFFKMTIA